MYNPNKAEASICKAIVEAAFKVHSNLGPGLLEKIYETCLCYELQKSGFDVKRQVCKPVIYDDLEMEATVRIDMLIEDKIICEIKAVEQVNPVWQAQILSYLKLTGNHIGFLINFNVPLLKNGIRRFCVE